MSTTSAPYGLKPVNLRSGQAYSGGTFREILCVTNNTNAIFTGDLVNITTGIPTHITATPTTTANGNTPIGVCVGVRYIDPVMKYQVYASFLPAGAITAGYLDVWVRVVDDPGQLFQVQADGAVARTQIGLNAQLTNFAAGSTTTGNSKIQLVSATIAGTATFGMRIVDCVNAPGSAPGDAYTDLIVGFNAGVQAYTNGTGQ